MAVQWHTQLFQHIDPLPLLEVYAYRNEILEFVKRVRTDRRVLQDADLPVWELEHNTHLAEFECVRLCSAYELSLQSMCDDSAVTDFLDASSGHTFVQTEGVLGYFRFFLYQFDRDNAVLNCTFSLREAMALQLCALAKKYPHHEGATHFGPVPCWTEETLCDYFVGFPLEEVRLPLTHAVHSLRKYAYPEFWTNRETLMFGKLPHVSEKQTDPSLFDGESWEDTL